MDCKVSGTAGIASGSTLGRHATQTAVQRAGNRCSVLRCSFSASMNECLYTVKPPESYKILIEMFIYGAQLTRHRQSTERVSELYSGIGGERERERGLCKQCYKSHYRKALNRCGTNVAVM